jgi:AcrR family transcriptional regulator
MRFTKICTVFQIGVDKLNTVNNNTGVMGTRERREREREEIRGKIMDAARDLFVSHGYEAVSMRKIAEAIEYSPTAIYVHFEDKAALMQQLCQHDFNSLAHVFHDLARITDPIERIRQTGHTYIRFAAQHPNHYRFMFMTPHAELQGECEIQKAYEADPTKNDPNENSYLFLFQACEQAIREGRLRQELTDPHLVAQTFWAAVHGVASIEVTFRNDPWIQFADLESRAATMVDGIIRGLVREGGES